MIKPVRTPESDHVRGHRREIDGEHPLSVNSHALGDVIHSNTLPMRSTLVPNKNWKPPKPSKSQRFGPPMPASPGPYKIERRRADADELLDAVWHSPEVESPYGNRPTLKHPTFTSRRRRGDEEEEG